MLRPATDADVETMRRWRNHPEVRAVSLTRHEIGVDEHAAWWDNTLARPDREVYIYEREGVASGVVTFFDLDREAATSWWGYYLDNDGLSARGELLPAWMEIQSQAVAFAFDELGLEVLEGEVLGANAAVRQMNRRTGLEEVGDETRDIEGEPTRVLHIRGTKQAYEAKKAARAAKKAARAAERDAAEAAGAKEKTERASE